MGILRFAKIGCLDSLTKLVFILHKTGSFCKSLLAAIAILNSCPSLENIIDKYWNLQRYNEIFRVFYGII